MTLQVPCEAADSEEDSIRTFAVNVWTVLQSWDELYSDTTRRSVVDVVIDMLN